MSNFKFLQREWHSLYSKLKTAEERVFLEPVSAAIYDEKCWTIYSINKKE